MCLSIVVVVSDNKISIYNAYARRPSHGSKDAHHARLLIQILDRVQEQLLASNNEAQKEGQPARRVYRDPERQYLSHIPFAPLTRTRYCRTDAT